MVAASSKFLTTHPPPMAPSVTNSNATNTTTIVQFNSVTQLSIKFAGSHNFSLWKAQVSMLMRGHNLYGHLDGTIPAPAETTTTNNLTISNPDYVNWFHQDHLRDHFALLTKESQHVADYLNQVRSLCDELATAGALVTSVELIVKILTGLGLEYREISTAIRARDTPISYAELFENLSDHELFLKYNAPPQSTLITVVVAQKSSSQTWTNASNTNRRKTTTNNIPSQGTIVTLIRVSHHVASDAHGLNNVADYNGPEEITMGNGSEYGGVVCSRAE
ncbi:hypothetical protein KY284_001239 [Solanum tuberosum]|nr:hypothetical protein KY284_001239 [Solanum tuberosum]